MESSSTVMNQVWPTMSEVYYGEWVSEQLLTEEVEQWFPEDAVVLQS